MVYDHNSVEHAACMVNTESLGNALHYCKKACMHVLVSSLEQIVITCQIP